MLTEVEFRKLQLHLRATRSRLLSKLSPKTHRQGQGDPWAER